MKHLIKLTGIAFLFIIVLSACSKEKRYEHKLSRKDGLWTISEYKHQVENDTTSYYIAQEYSGTIQFNENGTYTQNLIIDGTETVETGSWTNTEFQLKLSPAGQNQRNLGFNSVSKKKIVAKSQDVDFNLYEYEFYAMTLTRKD